jgi:hypothetical protein
MNLVKLQETKSTIRFSAKLLRPKAAERKKSFYAEIDKVGSREDLRLISVSDTPLGACARPHHRGKLKTSAQLEFRSTV